MLIGATVDVEYVILILVRSRVGAPGANPRVIESVSLLPLNISIRNDPNLSIPGSAIATINSPKVNNLIQQGGLYRFEEENLRVSNHDPSFTMRDTPNEMYRYTVDCLFLEVNNEIHMSKIQIQSFSPDILFHFFNLMYYYFNYVGEICAEKGILKRCIYTFLTGGFSNLKLEDFESWYLNQKETFLNDGLIDDVPDLTYFLISSDRAGRSLNEDDLKEEQSVSPQLQKLRTTSLTDEFNTSPIATSVNSSNSKKRKLSPIRAPGGNSSRVGTPYSRVGTPYSRVGTPYPISQSLVIPTPQTNQLSTIQEDNSNQNTSLKLPIFGAQIPPFGSPGRVIYNPKARIPTAPGSASNSQNTRGGRQTRKRKYRKTRKTRKNYE
jgi:hypothetical protein